MNNEIRELDVDDLVSKANCASRDEMTIDELNHVSGGSLNYGHIEWTYTSQKGTSTPAKPDVWTGCAWVPQ